ncbi:MAG: nitrite/sulfite reductase, partial [Rhodoblastus sp.]|nr:nitrite/sulfite reductase [Rhodoblastus sp.]
HIGILGLEKRGQESYQVTLGGEASDNLAIGELLGPGLSADEVADAIERIVAGYLAKRRPGETFIEAVRRLGVNAFKSAFLRGAQDAAA